MSKAPIQKEKQAIIQKNTALLSSRRNNVANTNPNITLIATIIGKIASVAKLNCVFIVNIYICQEKAFKYFDLTSSARSFFPIYKRVCNS
jgi:hypothetical protein